MAARTVFARHGFRHTSMTMVAEEAGLSRQAVYHHFASKEQLFAALVDNLQEAALESARLATSSAGRVPSRAVLSVMTAYHRSLVDSVAGSSFAAELVEESGRQCGSVVATHAQRFERLLTGLLDDLVRGGELVLRTGTSSRGVVGLLITASKGVKLQHAADGETAYARALKQMVDVICAGVTVSGGSRQRVAPAASKRVARRVAG